MSTAIEVRQRLGNDSRMFFTLKEKPLGKGHKGAVIGQLNTSFGGDLNRRICLGWLFVGVARPISSRDLKEGHWYALWKWLGLHHDDSGWHPCPSFLAESTRVLGEALRAYFLLNPGLQLESMVLDTPELGFILSQFDGNIKAITVDRTDNGGEKDQ